jgi:hypothetical protein
MVPLVAPPEPEHEVICGPISSYDVCDNGIIVRVVYRGKLRQVLLSKYAFVVSHFPRIEHDLKTAAEWLQQNPNGNVAVGLRCGIVENVIFHPEGQPGERNVKGISGVTP